MKAGLLLHEKIINEDASVVEIKIWQLEKTTHYPLGVKYSLYLVKNGEVLVGYDNHFPKGPHRHYGKTETEYEWMSIQKLIQDFKTDVEKFLI
ncbi:MAG: hypothetical protein HQM15_02385 [Deltaproteobacteria bacterium]|nr:hypothetical protein [Deltaproteobacteria bacterium]